MNSSDNYFIICWTVRVEKKGEIKKEENDTLIVNCIK